MRLLIIHNEATYVAGAQKMLGYFLEGLRASDWDIHLALVSHAKPAELIPAGIRQHPITNNENFSLSGLWRQIREIRRCHRQNPFDVLHGWAARDWELTASVRWLLRRPAVGTLHDHPQARFFSAPRRRLMRWSGRWGLDRIACVSAAVQQACLEAGLPARKLAVIHNGLPDFAAANPRSPEVGFRIGFLGVFSERKGLNGFFEMLDWLAQNTAISWEAHVAGGSHDDAGERLVKGVCRTYESKPWWRRIRWIGWVKQPREFLQSIDVLICPSVEFDPFPTVLLEAGQAGIPVVAARVGGVPEIVVDGRTGWLFEPGDWRGGGQILAALLAQPEWGRLAGERGRERMQREFTIGKMVASYLNLYSTF